MLEVPHVDVERTCEEGTQENYKKNLHPSLQNMSDYVAYLESMSPDAEDRYKGLLVQRDYLNIALENASPGHSSAQVDTLKNIPSDLWKKRLIGFVKALSKKIIPSPDVDNLEYFRAFCGVDLDCMKAFSEMVSIMNIGSLYGSAVSLIPAITDVALNRHYIAPINDFSKKVETKVEKAKRGEKIEIGSVWTDLVDSFKAHGFDEKKAHSAAFNVMGIIGTRGAAADPLFEIAPENQVSYENQKPDYLIWTDHVFYGYIQPWFWLQTGTSENGLKCL